MRFLVVAALFISGCSPLYFARSGVEQLRILNRREPIAEVLADDSTTAEVRRKLELINDARDFCKTLGLDPKQTFTSFAAVDKEALLWVLSGSEKLSFTPTTWWFPIVGTIPYKGFFEKYDGMRALERLKRRGRDGYLRPSIAFSSLGWFDDPVVSTFLQLDDIALVETVIHETVHTTFWIPGAAPFNESMANFIGQAGAAEFFLAKRDQKKAEIALARLRDEILFGAFVAEVKSGLAEFYQTQSKNESSEERSLSLRKEQFQYYQQRWLERRKSFETDVYRKRSLELNNAVIIALEIYLQRLDLFDRLFEKHGRNVTSYVEFLINYPKRMQRSGLSAWAQLEADVNA